MERVLAGVVQWTIESDKISNRSIHFENLSFHQVNLSWNLTLALVIFVDHILLYPLFSRMLKSNFLSSRFTYQWSNVDAVQFT